VRCAQPLKLDFSSQKVTIETSRGIDFELAACDSAQAEEYGGLFHA